MRIDFSSSDPLSVNKGDTIEIVTDISRGDLVTFRRASRGKVELRAIEKNAASKCRTKVFRVEKGEEPGTISLLRWAPAIPKRRRKAFFSFGIFEFGKFSKWMLHQYVSCCSGIDSVLEHYERAVDAAGLSPIDYPKAAIHRAYDTSYLSILALAVYYSIREDLLEDDNDSADLMLKQTVARAAYMLDHHAKYLPVKRPRDEDPQDGSSMFERRAAFVGHWLIPMAISGFESPLPSIQQMKSNLPKPLKSLLRKHEHKDEPLCHFIIAAFYAAFQWFPPQDDERYWEPLIWTFWQGWESHLLDVSNAIDSENLEAHESDDV